MSQDQEPTIRTPEEVFLAYDECSGTENATSFQTLAAWFIEQEQNELAMSDELLQHTMGKLIPSSIIRMDKEIYPSYDGSTIGSNFNPILVKSSREETGQLFFPNQPKVKRILGPITCGTLSDEDRKPIEDMFKKRDNSVVSSSSNNAKDRIAPSTNDESIKKKIRAASEKPDRVTENSFRTASGNVPSPAVIRSDSMGDFNHQIGKRILTKKVEGAEPEVDHLREIIVGEILQSSSTITSDSIVGLDDVKETLVNSIIFPLVNPQFFFGLFEPQKGLLLFGPPGNGKTMIGRWLANETSRTFFSIAASSLTSKWIGESEKLVRMLFQVAKEMQPSIIFMDEIDSILKQRNDEHDSTTRQKTEFLLRFDGVDSKTTDQILVVGATNRPQDLDEAARRRFTKRIYIPLPSQQGRKEIVRLTLKDHLHQLSEENLEEIARRTEGFSGADMNCLCKDAGNLLLRETIDKLGKDLNERKEKFKELEPNSVPLQFHHFDGALGGRRPSVSKEEIQRYIEWNKEFGSSK